MELTRRLEGRLLSRYLAKAAVAYAQAQRKNDQTNYDSLYELKTATRKELGKGKFIYRLNDEESKINLNHASLEIIQRLPGINPELAQNILNSDLKPFYLKEEVLLIEGMTPEIFAGCKDTLTVYSNGKVNINTAGEDALRALGFDENLINVINDFRLGEDGQEETKDDRVFENTGEITAKLCSFRIISEAEQASLLQLISQGLISVESENFLQEIETVILDKPAMKYAVVIDKQKIKQWEEY